MAEPGQPAPGHALQPVPGHVQLLAQPPAQPRPHYQPRPHRGQRHGGLLCQRGAEAEAGGAPGGAGAVVVLLLLYQARGRRQLPGPAGSARLGIAQGPGGRVAWTLDGFSSG